MSKCIQFSNFQEAQILLETLKIVYKILFKKTTLNIAKLKLAKKKNLNEPRLCVCLFYSYNYVLYAL